MDPLACRCVCCGAWRVLARCGLAPPLSTPSRLGVCLRAPASAESLFDSDLNPMSSGGKVSVSRHPSLHVRALHGCTCAGAPARPLCFQDEPICGRPPPLGTADEDWHGPHILPSRLLHMASTYVFFSVVWIRLPRSCVGQPGEAQPLCALALDAAACCPVLSSPRSLKGRAGGASPAAFSPTSCELTHIEPKRPARFATLPPRRSFCSWEGRVTLTLPSVMFEAACSLLLSAFE